MCCTKCIEDIIYCSHMSFGICCEKKTRERGKILANKFKCFFHSLALILYSSLSDGEWVCWGPFIFSVFYSTSHCLPSEILRLFQSVWGKQSGVNWWQKESCMSVRFTSNPDEVHICIWNVLRDTNEAVITWRLLKRDRLMNMVPEVSEWNPVCNIHCFLSAVSFLQRRAWHLINCGDT